jgi:hypothetical protein
LRLGLSDRTRDARSVAFGGFQPSTKQLTTDLSIGHTHRREVG